MLEPADFFKSSCENCAISRHFICPYTRTTNTHTHTYTRAFERRHRHESTQGVRAARNDVASNPRLSDRTNKRRIKSEESFSWRGTETGDRLHEKEFVVECKSHRIVSN